MTNSNIGQLIRKQENQYITGNTVISKYVSVSQFETINKIEAYINSKHTSGEQDSMGREKPFFNIVTSAVNIWYRATDIDRKNIKVKPTKSSDDLIAMLATIHLQEWMRREYFGIFLNEWGRQLSKYGSAVTKFVEQGGKLHSINVPWSRIICDTVDFEANPVIEKLYLTPAQLQQRKGYDKKLVENLLTARTARKDLDKQNKDNKSEYIELYEIHGNLPKSYLTDKEKDKDEFVQQMQVVTFIATNDTGDFDDYVLVKGKEAKSPYLKDDLIKEEGQTLSIGAVQNLFEAQWMTNHSAKLIKDQLDLASKLIFQTSDGNFVGQNALSAIEMGDILIHADNKPLTQLQNNSHDITSLQAQKAEWKSLGMEINGISEAMQGQNQPTGSAWRQTEALLQESHSLFELMTENKGLAIERMLREFVIPYMKKTMGNSKEIAATLDSYNITKIDSRFIKNKAIQIGNAQMKAAITHPDFTKQETPPAQQANFQAIGQGLQGQLAQQGNQRYFAPSDISDTQWNELFKDMEWELEVDITGEQTDNQAAMDTLNTALKIFMSATPEQLENPNFKLVFNKILEQSAVISPLEIASIPPPPPQTPQNKVGESLNYKDAPDDIRRQIEQQAGLKPSTMTSQQPQQATPPVAANQPVGN